MEVLYPHCAGLDVHKETVVACARHMVNGIVTREVRTFGAGAGLRLVHRGLRHTRPQGGEVIARRTAVIWPVIARSEARKQSRLVGYSACTRLLRCARNDNLEARY